MNKKTIVLICGNMRSGKDSVADMLMEELDNIKRTDITSYLKRGVAKMLGISVKELEYIKDNGFILTENQAGDNLSVVTPRRILQHQADMCRPYLTCEKAMEELLSEDRDYYLLTGVRLPNEVDLIKRVHADKRVIVLKVERTDFEFKSDDKQHKTETLVDLIEHDYLIQAKDLDELKEKVGEFKNYLFKKTKI